MITQMLNRPRFALIYGSVYFSLHAAAASLGLLAHPRTNKCFLQLRPLFRGIPPIVALLTAAAFPGARAETFSIQRLNNAQPIISGKHFEAVATAPEEAENIQGPSVIRVPDWIPPGSRPSPRAVYYMYFAHHHGDYIRMAWSPAIAGPWTVFRIGSEVRRGERGVLDLGTRDRLDIGNSLVIKDHIASPDVHVDNTRRLIVMYFHAPTTLKGGYIGQKSLVATSETGLDFSKGIKPVILGRAYFRVFSSGEQLYAISNGGEFYRAPNPEDPWTVLDGRSTDSDLWTGGVNSFASDLKLAGHSGRLRHSTLYLKGDTLRVFYTRVGDSPETILMSTLKLDGRHYALWDSSFPPEQILRPEHEWEGASIKPAPSLEGYAADRLNQLRDPYVFADSDGALYLFYAGGGEQAIGVARLQPAGSPGPARKSMAWNKAH